MSSIQISDAERRPLFAERFEKIQELKSHAIPSEPLYETIGYAINQNEALCRYIEDGHLRPDSNTFENAMRRYRKPRFFSLKKPLNISAGRLTSAIVGVMGAANAVMKTVRYGIQVGEGGV